MSVPRARASYADIAIYSPGIGTHPVDLSDNTNLWGTPPAAARAIDAVAADVSRYPQPYSSDLRECLAEYAGVSAEMVVVGCGSDDIIDCTMRAFAEPGETVCMPDPTFSMIPVFAKMNGLRSIAVPLGDDRSIDVDGMLATRAAVAYLCTPNNPTGNAIPLVDAEDVVNNWPGVVIVDAAYAEFCGESVTSLAATGRAVVTRTMSKAFGLAGLRVGYGLAAPEIVRAIEKARGPYKVNAIAETAAMAVLAEDNEWVRSRIEAVIANRERFAAELRALGYAPLPSDANFILLPLRDCRATLRTLQRAGVAVRPFFSLAAIGDAVRITIGPWEMMQACLDALGRAE